jgi:hypothetical protein
MDFGIVFWFLVGLFSLSMLRVLTLRLTGHANAFEGLSGGFVYGAAGSGIITPHFDASPFQSGFDSPNVADDFAQNIGPVFRHEEEIMS